MRIAYWLLLPVLLGAKPAGAVLFYGTGDPGFNTTAPTGGLLDSGWQYQGAWGSSLGTAIAPNYFVTAKHLGGSVGDTFTYNVSNRQIHWRKPTRVKFAAAIS